MRKKTRQKVKITLISVLSLQKKKDQHQIISSSKSTPIRCNFSSIAGQVFIRINLVFEIGLGIIITRMQQGRTRNIFDEDGIIYYHNAKKKKTRENLFAGNSFVQKNGRFPRVIFRDPSLIVITAAALIKLRRAFPRAITLCSLDNTSLPAWSAVRKSWYFPSRLPACARGTRGRFLFGERQLNFPPLVYRLIETASTTGGGNFHGNFREGTNVQNSRSLCVKTGGKESIIRDY